MNGYGLETWSEGIVYRGYFTDGQKGPRGVLNFGDGDSYEGEFANNLINGKGRLINLLKKMMYEGQWKDNQMHGKGVYVWKDGRAYKGHYCEGEKDGLGIYKFVDGNIYVGYWSQGV